MTGSLPQMLYRAVTRFVEPAAPLLLEMRRRRGKEDRDRLGERLGIAGRARPAGPLAWVHGASVGESISLLPLVEAMLGRGLRVLVTTGTVTSARLLATRLPQGALHQFVPLDLPGAARRFFDHWRPDLVCFAESELWPNLLGTAAQRAIPAMLVNARMSERSLARWRRLPGLIAPLLRGLTAVLGQTETDAARFRTLGAARAKAVGNLKFDVPAPEADPAALAALRAMIGRRPVWIAASTHLGEEDLCCAVHRRVAVDRPDLLTVLVPRKADRGPAIAAAAEGHGAFVGLRSRGDVPDPRTQIYVADTMGEIGLFFRLSRVIFMGKSMAGNEGGHNPIEPAKLGAAILHGPSVANCTESYALLDAAGGSLVVADEAGLADAVARLLADPGEAERMGQLASAEVATQAGATARTMAAIEPALASMLPSATS